MPVYKTFYTHFDDHNWAKIMVWKITESVQKLSENLPLTSKSKKRLASMKSEIHQKGFLAVRKLLAECCILDQQLFYDKTGKPFLKENLHVSISHSHDFATIAISTVEIGIDIEQNREKIIRIANKFCGSEFDFLQKIDENYIQKLTTIWAAKESIFKIENQKGISFKDHISVHELNILDKKIVASLDFNGQLTYFEMHTLPVENFTLVYGTKIITL